MSEDIKDRPSFQNGYFVASDGRTLLLADQFYSAQRALDQLNILVATNAIHPRHRQGVLNDIATHTLPWPPRTLSGSTGEMVLYPPPGTF